ncbi:Hypothetical predicted protein [Paramuricea clavata]|uniref:Uncharacterized protein n=1 Tax=Paramuricea clavata TaxID=317549 RepID=A0A7D9H6M8_PARCT|nr:Hypothetical predicted protein [Paramuricea clavata]
MVLENNWQSLKLEKVRPGVLKLIKIPEKKKPAPHKIKLKKQNDEPKKVEPKKDLHHDNYWKIKENKEEKVDYTVYKDGPSHTVVPHHTKETKSEEYLKHICHPMCKKTCISSCAPGCCAGEHHQNFPLNREGLENMETPSRSSYQPRLSSDVQEKLRSLVSKGMLKHKAPVRKSHCHPLCKKNCLSSCPLSCCSHKDRLKEKCHPLCRKTCLPACPDECCTKKTSQHKLIMKSDEHKVKAVAKVKAKRTCPGLCPDVSN